jgi:hypothetical protein
MRHQDGIERRQLGPRDRGLDVARHHARVAGIAQLSLRLLYARR